MGGRLAHRLDPVVTRSAGAVVLAVIELADRPLLGRVAAVAIVLGAQVIGRHAAGPHRIVARLAVLRRSGEDPVLVAAFTADRGVGPGQREAGAEVIELDHGILGRRDRGQRRQQQRSEDRQNCREWSEPVDFLQV